jgi:hypothetical protein
MRLRLENRGGLGKKRALKEGEGEALGGRGSGITSTVRAEQKRKKKDQRPNLNGRGE